MTNLYDDSVIVSDVHYSQSDKSFLSYLDNCEAKQIILNGDIFEFISDHISESKKYNIDLINKINDLSKTKEILYLEGNHDFGLKNVFKKIKIIEIKDQPIKCKYKNKNVYIAHGDCFSHSIWYKIYTKIIRNAIFLKIINKLDEIIKNKLFYSTIKAQLVKDKCKKIENFEKISQNRITKYPKDADFIIEGHYHQNMNIFYDGVKYINLPAFCCDNNIYTIDKLINKE